MGKGSVWLAARVWEMQARGVLHVHPVLAYGTARQMAGARLYVERLAELAPHYGFGFAERKIKPQPAKNAAAYLSSYFVKGKRGKETLWESARSPAMPRSIVYVSVKRTMQAGCTMRALCERCSPTRSTMACIPARIPSQTFDWSSRAE